MTSRAATVAFQGIEAVAVDVQAQFLSGLVQFNVVGLGDKAVAESRERVRAALHAIGLALPGKRLVVNLSPADLPKEGSHFDLPISLAVLAALEILPQDFLTRYFAMGELALDGAIIGVSGVLPAAIAANGRDMGLICPKASGPEAAWAGEDADILAPENLIQLINHVKGTQVLTRPKPTVAVETDRLPDLKDVKGQESGKRALEVAAAGGHHLLMLLSSRPSSHPLRLFRTGVPGETRYPTLVDGAFSLFGTFLAAARSPVRKRRLRFFFAAFLATLQKGRCRRLG